MEIIVQSSRFRKLILDFYEKYGRRHLPWRHTRDPYHILVSEIMLQQTQVERVIGKYWEFIEKFPNFKSLAQASTAQVLKAWSGLGYNRRALYLKRTAERVTAEFKEKLPRDLTVLVDLPGVGPNTAAAICAYAFNMPVAFIETNIRRIFIHHFFPKKRNVRDADILPLVRKTLDMKRPREWYSALMDYGAHLKGEVENPNRRSGQYAKQSKFEGSDRQLRGRILKLLLVRGRMDARQLARGAGEPVVRVGRILDALLAERFIREDAAGRMLIV
ncbi:MAG: A/G-specific adenine glycosylase [Patescibacteria group bacterium]|nr:A/G-specific adenine glycosylase [Patescibacteria group bacterium]MDE1946079.1 A/G-specific adenine glycosylase [Patescibacteria group bacterium]